MSPLNPIRPVPADTPARSDQIPDDEENASELVDIGRRTADSERRDAVTERYVDEANAGDDTDEALADIARVEAGDIDRNRADAAVDLPPREATRSLLFLICPMPVRWCGAHLSVLPGPCRAKTALPPRRTDTVLLAACIGP